MKQVFVAAMLALVLVPLAQAGGPVQSSTPWDRTRVIPASAETCAFPIQVHSTGTIHTWTYSDGTQKTILQNFHIEWKNLDTGAVATSPLGGSASKADNRFPVRRLMLQKNRRFRVPVFLPSMWAGRKFQSCARRCKKFLRSSYRVSSVRDTSSRRAAEVRAFSCEKAKYSQWLMHRRNSSNEFCRHTLSASCALNSERKAAVGNAAYIHKRGVGILEQTFNHDFRFAVIQSLRVDDVVL